MANITNKLSNELLAKTFDYGVNQVKYHLRKTMKYLTTGEFAKLCGTSKDTLIFYDRQGLLKPSDVNGKKYRRYTLVQYFDYDLINMLKETGSSLAEIKEHLAHREPARMLQLFQQKKIKLDQEKKRIAQRARLVDELIAITKEAISTRYGIFEIMEMKEQTLELMRIDATVQESEEDCVSSLVEFNRHFESQNRIPTGPFGILTSRADVLSRNYFAGFFFCGAARQTPKADLHIKPKGKYATIAHLGDVKSHKQAYIEFINKIENDNYKIMSGVYAYDLIGYLISDAEASSYGMRYCVLVE